MAAREEADIELARAESTLTHEQLVDRFAIPASEFTTVEAFADEFMLRLDHWINAGATVIELPLDLDGESRRARVAELAAKYDAAMIEALFGSYADKGSNPGAIEDITQEYHATVLDSMSKCSEADSYIFRGTLSHQIVSALQDGSSGRVELAVRYTDNGDENTVGRYRMEQGLPVVYDVDMGTMQLESVVDADGNWKVVSFAPAA